MESGSPRVADRYEIVRTLGNGAFGQTFLARDTSGGSDVAIKMFHPHRAVDWKAFELFERETAVLRALRHHGIPEVLDAFRDRWEGADAAFLVMEYVEGTSLARMIDEKHHLGVEDAMHVFLEMLTILEYLHSRVPPILHRDIKPANIIIRPNGFPALVDFGAVRSVFKSPDEGGSTVVGTFGYMPYEQYMGQATPSSDLYALGATFLHLLTGRPPPEFIAGEGRIAVPEGLPGDARLRAVLERLLRPSPAERFQDARDVRRAVLSPSQSRQTVIKETPPAPAATSSGPMVVQPLVALAPNLPPAPRPLVGETKEWLDAASHSMWSYADSTAKPDQEYGATDVLLFAFFCVATVGIMPAVFFSVARNRRRRLRTFFKEGVPGVAVVLNLQPQDLAFGSKLTSVAYEFEVDGTRFRDTDQILPVIADRFRPGDQVPILYRPDRGYDSVIVATF